MKNFSLTPVVLDLNLWEKNPLEFSEILGHSFSRYGYITLKNHPVQKISLENVYQKSRIFFNLKQTEKDLYFHPEKAGLCGYLTIEKDPGNKRNTQRVEMWHSVNPESTLFENHFPYSIFEFQKSFQTLYFQMGECSDILLKACALYLGLPIDFYTQKIIRGWSILRAMHYPRQVDTPSEDDRTSLLSVNPHTDISLFTLLDGGSAQGLEIALYKDQWFEVGALSNEMTVCIGEIFSEMTQGQFKPACHRVKRTEGKETRLSLPYFVVPRPEENLDFTQNTFNPVYSFLKTRLGVQIPYYEELYK